MENISQLTNAARGTDKTSCIEMMGGITQIKNFLLGKTYTPAKINQGAGFTTTPSGKDQQAIQGIQTTTTGTSTIKNTITSTTTTARKAVATEYGQYAINGIVIFVVGILMLIIIRNMLRFFYDVFNSRRIVYLKILLPRGQSKLDREQEKELAKDMKEKI